MIKLFHQFAQTVAGLVFCASAVFAPVAIASEKKVLEPSSPWKIDYAQNECRMLRSFGSGPDAMTMRLARGSGLDSFDMVIAGAAIAKLPQRIDLAFGLDPQGSAQTVEAYTMAVPGRPERFIRWFDAKPDLLPAVTNNQIVTIRFEDRVDIAMRWTDGAAALAALETCHLDLLKSWGIDVALIKAAKVRPQPVGSPARWATNSDYPTAAQRDEKEGNVIFQLTVAPDGTVANCVVVQSSLVPELDEATCALTRKRAKFTPALDANDQPIVGFYINRIRWQIPK